MSGGILLNEPSPQVGLPALQGVPLMAPVFSAMPVAGHIQKATMVISLADPSPHDVDAIRIGRVDVAARVYDGDDIAFLNWKFSPAGGLCFHVRTALHLGLMDMQGEYDPSDLLGTGEDGTVVLLLQDQRPYFRVLRFVSMPSAVSAYLAPTLARQLAHRHLTRAEIVRRRNMSTDRYLDEFPAGPDEFASAPVKGEAW